ncbi:MAG: hypothetical protein JWR84_1601 [Caulobacter sp.]|nr:hypothetical protein [Caulobacter sp.]
MKPVVPALILALTAGAAHAALAPQYYQQARDEAPNVIVLDIAEVGPPAGDAGPCLVSGKVHQVERGTRYRNGQTIAIRVPCKTPKAEIPAGGTIWQDRAALGPGKRARAWLDNAGDLALYQFELLR